jgi:hypothetical protein
LAKLLPACKRTRLLKAVWPKQLGEAAAEKTMICKPDWTAYGDSMEVTVLNLDTGKARRLGVWGDGKKIHNSSRIMHV